MPRNQPQSGNAMPRFAGLATMMRLPAASSAAGLDAAFVGVPLDIGTSNRTGARFGPRQIRAESALLRPYNMATGAAPFDTLQVADLGDVPVNTYSLEKSLTIIKRFYDDVIAADCRPLTLGGDHTIALPILRAIAKKHGPVALVHVDAHADVNDEMFGEGVAHGTPFRRAVDILPRALRQFQAEAPGIRVQLHDMSTEEMLAGLRENKIAVAVMVQQPTQNLRGLQSLQLQCYRVSAAVSPLHPLARRKQIALSEIVGERIVGYSQYDYP